MKDWTGVLVAPRGKWPSCNNWVSDLASGPDLESAELSEVVKNYEVIQVLCWLLSQRPS